MLVRLDLWRKQRAAERRVSAVGNRLELGGVRLTPAASTKTNIRFPSLHFLETIRKRAKPLITAAVLLKQQQQLQLQ